MLEGAAIADVRILVQSGWSDINQEWFLRTSEAIERRYNKASAYATNWNSVSSAESNNTDKGSIIAPDKASVLSSSILGAIGQPMASSASSSTDSCSSGSGVVRRGLAPFHKDDENDIMSMPAISGIQGTRWRATDALLIGNFPHDKLFPRVSAVVHHGGAGTTAGGLIAGKPTFICPFFGDQNFWGEMVQKSGLGPAPCLVEQLTPQIVAEKFMKLLSADVQSRARKVSVDMKAEGNGVELGALAFYRHLPIENMLCDVSLMRHEVRLAQVFCKTCGLKMARNISDILHSVMCCGASTEETKKGGYEPHRRNSRSKSVSEVASGHDVVPCVYVDWSLPPPGGVVDGVLQGAGALAHETLGAIADAFTDPLKGVYYGGIQGGIQGVYSGLRSLATRPVAGTRVMYDKVSEGMRNTGLTSRSSRSLGNNSGIERTVDERESGGVAPEVQADDADDDLPEQAARWYGENSMLLMSTSAQAKADRSLLFSEEVMGEAYPAVGARSVIQRYGPQGFMESTIIEELDNEDCESIVDESDTVGDSSASMAVAAVTLLQNIITSDRVASPNTAGTSVSH